MNAREAVTEISMALDDLQSLAEIVDGEDERIEKYDVTEAFRVIGSLVDAAQAVRAAFVGNEF